MSILADPTIDQAEALGRLDAALAEQKVTESAAQYIKIWLTEERYADYEAQVRAHIEQGMWQELDDAFWTIIPFGTGGRRGRMYPIGCNVINDRTIGESAAGLATYVKQNRDDRGELSCAIAYDTRHNSRHFAELCSRIMVAAGYKVCFLDDYRSTPELSFMVRHKQCSCGIMVTASHNPPSDNAVKVYWSTGGQVLPPHDKGIIDCVMSTELIDMGDSFAASVSGGKVEICTADMDAAFLDVVTAQALPGPRDLKIIFSPLHGVGASAVLPVLEADGFTQVELFGPHAEPSGDFPNVPGHVSNPERPEVYASMIERAQATGSELILCTDPDCDRIGAASPKTADTAGEWTTFTGNQIAALLADYALSARKAKDALSPDHYVVKTLVTTEMVRRIADSYGVKTVGDLLVGFKYIGGAMDEYGPDQFVFGCEESHGYLTGSYARDKDGAVAAMLMAELAAAVKAEGQSLNGRLDSLYWQHGYHAERLVNQVMPGSEGMHNMRKLMAALRSSPPRTLGGIEVASARDYLNGNRLMANGSTQPLSGPTGDMVILDLAHEGNYIAVRPSGTEPKVKFYMFAYVPAELLADLEETKAEMANRLEAVAADLKAFAESV